MKFRVFLIMLFSAFVVQVQAQYYRGLENKVRCIYTDMDGSITVRAVGEGRKKNDAREHAMKNAVYAVIFKGVTIDGKINADLTTPLIKEFEAEKKYAEDFYTFFQDGGRYLEFVSEEDRRRRSDIKLSKNKIQVVWEFTVRVKRAELLQYLKDEGIVKY